MEKETVALWIGMAQSEDIVDKLTSCQYDEAEEIEDNGDGAWDESVRP